MTFRTHALSIHTPKRPRGAALAAVLLLALLAPAPAPAAPTAWGVDRAHSSVSFRIRHFFSQVPGRFQSFDGALTYDEENPAASSMEFTIEAASIDTDQERRDGHLRSPDFFNVEKFPQIAFRSRKVEKTSEANVYEVTGDFTLIGVTQPVTVRVEVLGFGPDGMGGTRGGLSVTGVIRRSQFDMKWNKVFDDGSTMLSDEVKIEVALEVVKKA
jgi:polyisoprenoid-binding protein YceI